VLELAPPPGFLGQRREVVLEAGEREIIRVALDPVGTGHEPSGEADEIVSEPIEPIEPAEPAAASVHRPARPFAGAHKASDRKSRTSRSARDLTRAAPQTKTATPPPTAPAPAPAATATGTGTLMIGAKPPCEITIDGRRTGKKTPQRSIELGAGDHTIELVSPEHGIVESFTVTIEPGKTKRVIKDMADRIP
jgi:hypothetical protein